MDAHPSRWRLFVDYLIVGLVAALMACGAYALLRWMIVGLEG